MEAARLRILIAEDEQMVAMDIEQALLSLGYEVAGIAESGRNAIRLAEQSVPDLVLMDIRLKGKLDGVTAAAEIRRRWQIPVVFVTANTNDETLVRAKAASPYGYIIKPFRIKELNATIVVAMHQHRLVQEMFAEHDWLSTVLGSISDAVVAADASGTVRYLNPIGESMTGWTLAEATGKPIEEIHRVTTLEGAAVAQCQLRKAILGMAPTGKQRFMLRARRGQMVPVEEAAAPILNLGRTIGAVTVFRNIAETLYQERRQEEERDRLEEQMQSASLALGQTRAELRNLSGHLITAQEEERWRIARELHDDFGQRLAVMDMCAERLAEHMAGHPATLAADAQRELAMIREQIRELDAGMREVSHRLHPSVLADIGLPAGLRALVDDFRLGGGEASLRVSEGFGEISLEIATALYRIVQEALRNVAKHAPGAPVRINLNETGQEIRLSIEDAGPGFDVNKVRAKGGLGLLSMQERARLAGGTLQVRTDIGTGTLLVISIPR
jgi:PAS domain S-box-containing protein